MISPNMATPASSLSLSHSIWNPHGEFEAKITQRDGDDWALPKTFRVNKVIIDHPEDSSGVAKIYLSGENNRRLVIVMPYAMRETENTTPFVIREDDPTTVIVGPVEWLYHSYLGFPFEEEATVEIALQRNTQFIGDLYIMWTSLTGSRKGQGFLAIELENYHDPKLDQLYENWLKGF